MSTNYAKVRNGRHVAVMAPIGMERQTGGDEWA